jgi:hypothetical protein
MKHTLAILTPSFCWCGCTRDTHDLGLCMYSVWNECCCCCCCCCCLGCDEDATAVAGVCLLFITTRDACECRLLVVGLMFSASALVVVGFVAFEAVWGLHVQYLGFSMNIGTLVLSPSSRPPPPVVVTTSLLCMLGGNISWFFSHTSGVSEASPSLPRLTLLLSRRRCCWLWLWLWLWLFLVLLILFRRLIFIGPLLLLINKLSSSSVLLSRLFILKLAASVRNSL